MVRAQRGIVWCFDTKKRLRAFPKDAKIRVGYALSEAQMGRKADYCKPLTGLGAGVLEVVVESKGDTYRTVYAVKIGEDIYVLHAFKKKSKSGIATPKHDIDLVRERLRSIQRTLAQKP